jgi:hypothetical protein
VGVHIPAGTYRTTDEDCYWAKLRSWNTDDMADFNYGVGSVTVDSAWFRISIANNARYNQCVLTKVG